MKTLQQIDHKALRRIKDEAYRGRLTFQQYATLKGQVLAGDGDGALKGLRRILSREEPSRDSKIR